MKKTEAKEIAMDIMQSAIGCAYYRLESENYSEKEVELICRYINVLGERACKAINLKYITY